MTRPKAGSKSGVKVRAFGSARHAKRLADARRFQIFCAVRPAGGWDQPPRRIMSKKSTFVLVAFMFLIMSSMDSISSMLYMN